MGEKANQAKAKKRTKKAPCHGVCAVHESRRRLREVVRHGDGAAA